MLDARGVAESYNALKACMQTSKVCRAHGPTLMTSDHLHKSIAAISSIELNSVEDCREGTPMALYAPCEVCMMVLLVLYLVQLVGGGADGRLMGSYLIVST